MKKSLSFLGVFLFIVFANQASAITINNSSFEDTTILLNGWDNSGASIAQSIFDANGTLYSPTDPYYFAELTGNNAYISQVLTWVAGETISFDWNYLNFDAYTDDNQDGNNDYSGYFIIGDDSGATIVTTITTNGSNSTGWQNFTYTFTSDSASGSYIKFGVDYSSDNAFTAPVLLVDNLAAPVPEPATMMLFGIGLLGLAGVTRRKRA